MPAHRKPNPPVKISVQAESVTTYEHDCGPAYVGRLYYWKGNPLTSAERPKICPRCKAELVYP